MDSDKEKRKYIIDTSAFRPPIPSKRNLVINNRGEPCLEDNARSSLSQHSILLIELDAFVKGKDTLYLPEVIEENERFLTHLIYQRDFLQTLRMNGDFEEYQARQTFAENMSDYIRHFRAFNEDFRSRAFSASKLNPLQSEIYRLAYERAKVHHKNHDELGEIKTFGDMLDTDRKLIATTVATAIRQPVVIVSRDKRIVGDLDRGERGDLQKVVQDFRFGKKQRRGFNLNPYEIRVYNPSSSDNGFYDAEKERVVYERRN